MLELVPLGIMTKMAGPWQDEGNDSYRQDKSGALLGKMLENVLPGRMKEMVF